VSKLDENVKLRISLVSVHVLIIADGEDEEAIQAGIEVYLNLLAGETKIGLDYESLEISSEFTNDYWESIPDVAARADQDDHGIWQQMIWDIEGDFEILTGMSAQVAAESISWELIFEHQFTEQQVEDPAQVQYFKVLEASFIK
jgi:hypothetical protein